MNNNNIKYKDFFSELSDDELSKQIDEIHIEKIDMSDAGHYNFEVNGLQYVVLLLVGNLFNGETFGEVSFEIKNHPKAKNDADKDRMKYQLVGNSGNGIAVMCKVFGSVWGYLDKHPLDYIYFSGKGGDRKRMYDLFSDRHVSKYLPDYKKIDYDPNTNDPLNESEYWFKRTK